MRKVLSAIIGLFDGTIENDIDFFFEAGAYDPIEEGENNGIGI